MPSSKRPPTLSLDDLDTIELALYGSIRDHKQAALNSAIDPEWGAWYERQIELESHALETVRAIGHARGEWHEANPLPPILEGWNLQRAGGERP